MVLERGIAEVDAAAQRPVRPRRATIIDLERTAVPRHGLLVRQARLQQDLGFEQTQKERMPVLREPAATPGGIALRRRPGDRRIDLRVDRPQSLPQFRVHSINISAPMKLCISQTCTLATPFADDIAGLADGGCHSIEVWLTKLEQHLERESVDSTKRLLADRGVELLAAAYHGGLLLSQGEARRLAFDHFQRRLELCQQFGIPTLLVAADFQRQPDQSDLGRAIVSLAQAAQWAAGFDVRLGLEFRGSDAFCTNLETALLLVEQSGEPNVGICLDAFHYHKGPSKPEDLERLTNANLAHVQLCDVPGVPRELMTDSDRVFPGEGDFRLAPIVDTLKRIGYTAAVSLEVMNPMIRQSKPTQVAELGMTALKRTISE